MDLSKAKKGLSVITNNIYSELDLYKYDRYTEIEVESPSNADADEKQLARVSTNLANRLKDIRNEWAYYQREIKYETILQFNKNERYEEAETGLEYTSGSFIEYYDEEYNEWDTSYVEHSERYNGYYIVNNPSIRMNGLKVRVRSK